MGEGYKSMGLLTKEQIRELIKERNMKNTEDISLMFKDLFGETPTGDDGSRDGYNSGVRQKPADGKQTENRRNGHSKKTIISEFSETEIAVPRDRDGEDEPLNFGTFGLYS